MKIYTDDNAEDFFIPKSVEREIIINYLQKTYYWSVGILCLIIGFLLGVIA